MLFSLSFYLALDELASKNMKLKVFLTFFTVIQIVSQGLFEFNLKIYEKF